MRRRLTQIEVVDMADVMTDEIIAWQKTAVGETMRYYYAIPRGGVPVGYLAQSWLPSLVPVDRPEEAELFIDDIVDSGRTRQEYRTKFPGIPFFALVDKTKNSSLHGAWIEFPWEGEVSQDMETTVTRLLQQIGEDPERGGLIETPARVARAWEAWTDGYNVDIPSLLKSFEDGGESYDEMVIVRGIPFYSHCEHHMAPFFGTADIGYIPNGTIVGLSKLSRLLDAFAHRLQVQERLTQQVARALMDHLKPKGVGVSITARHLCMESRGIAKQGSETVTTSLLGAMREPAVRAEFFSR